MNLKAKILQAYDFNKGAVVVEIGDYETTPEGLESWWDVVEYKGSYYQIVQYSYGKRSYLPSPKANVYGVTRNKLTGVWDITSTLAESFDDNASV